MADPILESVDETKFKISWTPPSEDGGCPVTGYGIFRDDGAGSALTTEIDAAAVNNKPSLFEH